MLPLRWIIATPDRQVKADPLEGDVSEKRALAAAPVTKRSGWDGMRLLFGYSISMLFFMNSAVGGARSDSADGPWHADAVISRWLSRSRLH